MNAAGTVTGRTLPEVLRAAAATFGEREAYVHGDQRVTYRELERAAEGVATSLVRAGVRPGDVVVLELASSPQFAMAYLGSVLAGAIVTAINHRLGARERESIHARTDPAFVFRAPEEVDAAAATEPAPAALQHTAAPSDPVCIVWTSGTTGLPKGAVYDHEAMRVIHEGMGDLTAPGDRRLVSLPFAHMGFMTRVWDELAAGTTLVLVGEPWSATKQIELLARERITMCTGVPTQWQLVLDHPSAPTIDLSNLRVAGIGAASIPPELIRRMRDELGCPVITRYTSTEAGLLTGTRLTDEPETVATTVGVASRVVEMRIVDPATDEIVAPGVVGEVRCRSRAMFRGYWRDPELSAAALDAEGFLRTGDLGFVGDDGNLRLVGRLKEMYIRGGYNVYPAEVEAILTEHPGVATAAVVGAPAPVLGEIGVAFVVASDGATPPSLAELREWCASQLADYKAPDHCFVVDELPLTAMLKVDKQALTAHARAQLSEAT